MTTRAVYYLNRTVYCKLGPSKIHGVGVFAIRDIPKGQQLTDYTLDDVVNEKEYETLSMSLAEFTYVLPSIQALILDRLTLDKERNKEIIYCISPNRDQILQSFMNHSNTPNSDGNFALRDIKAGEEVTEDFNTLTETPHKWTKKHYSFL